MNADRDVSLPEFLSLRARGASDARLVLDVALGVTAIGTAIAFRPAGRLLLVSGGAAIAAFGIWGVADRELGERDSASVAPRFFLHAARVVAAAVGAIGALFFLFAGLGLALGRIVS